jgi:hypothetical protein
VAAILLHPAFQHIPDCTPGVSLMSTHIHTHTHASWLLPPLQMGTVHRVTVYPSDYGLQRMAEEAERGPKVGGTDRGGLEESGSF